MNGYMAGGDSINYGNVINKERTQSSGALVAIVL